MLVVAVVSVTASALAASLPRSHGLVSLLFCCFVLVMCRCKVAEDVCRSVKMPLFFWMIHFIVNPQLAVCEAAASIDYLFSQACSAYEARLACSRR